MCTDPYTYPGLSLCPPWVFLHPPTKFHGQGWSLYLRGIIGIKLAPWAAGPGRRADRGWGTDVLLALRGLRPQSGSKLQIIITELWAPGPWLRNLGPGHPGLGLRWVAGLASWEILHKLAQFGIITAVIQEALDLGMGGGEVGVTGGSRMGRLRHGRRWKGKKESTCD